MNKIVNVSGVSLNYQAKNGEIQAISDISMDIFEGEFLSIVGPSGCGKSTLLSIICGLLPPSGGAVYIAGEPVHGPSPLIGFMPQKDHLFSWRTVYENVRLGRCTPTGCPSFGINTLRSCPAACGSASP